MSLKTIIISLNDTENLDCLLPTCTALATRHEAHLIGAYIIPSAEMYAAFDGAAMAEIADAQRKNFFSMAKKVKEKFDRAISPNNLSAEWLLLDAQGSSMIDEFIQQSRFADLVVITQVELGAYNGVEAGFSDSIVMDAGRPVLIVPRGKSFDSIGDKVVIGWNASKEATRACYDALPLLSNNCEVDLVWVDPQLQRLEAGNLPGTKLGTTLARHGIKVTCDPTPTVDSDAGAALLNRVGDIGADLLVMGAYGHSRLSEFVFGGATDHVFKKMTVPVLMSH